jgi:O-antigen ligase
MQAISQDRLSKVVTGCGVAIGLATGVLVSSQPLIVFAIFAAIGMVFYFFADFNRVVIGLLVLRSSLDVLSAQQLPSVLAIGVDLLTLLYISVQLLQRKKVYADSFWLFFAGWVLLQGIWPLLCIAGGLGFEGWALSVNLREWTRLFSWLMMYLLVMQLKGRLEPETIISLLFLSLILPMLAAGMQIFLPESLLPSQLRHSGNLQENRIFGTLGHANTFSCYLLLFIGLTWWKISYSKRRWIWILLLVPLLFAYVGTHSLMSLVMLTIFVVIIASTRLRPASLLGGLVVISMVFALFASSEFGRARLETLSETPIFNPNIDVSRAILLQKTDNNTFNWRLYHWTALIEQWKKSKLLGYGLATAIYVAPPDSPFIPHNDYVRALVEGGLVGLSTFLAFLAAQAFYLLQLISKAAPGSPQRELSKVLFAVLLATFVAMSTDNVWICTTFYFYWWALLPICAWDWNKATTNSNA